MERKVIDQLLKENGVELDEEVKKNLTDSLLSKFHAELNAEKALTQAEKDKAKEAQETLAQVQGEYESAVKNSEDLDSLKNEIKNLKAQNKTNLEQIEAKYQAKLLDNAIELALTQAGAKNNRAAAALIDKSGLKLNEDGSVLGLSELIDSVKGNEDTSFLFNQPEPKEEKKVYNYVPQGDAQEHKADPIDALFNKTNHINTQRIIGAE